MKLVKIRSLKHPDPAINWDFEAQDPQPKLDELLSSGVCGKPERWVSADEPHDLADVLEEREVVVQEASPKVPEVWNEQGELVQAEVPELPAVVKKEVKLKAEYSIEIIDVSAEHELAECLAKRKAEYPSPEDFLNAWFDGGDAALEELKQKRLAVKAKHPKPVGV